MGRRFNREWPGLAGKYPLWDRGAHEAFHPTAHRPHSICRPQSGPFRLNRTCTNPNDATKRAWTGQVSPAQSTQRGVPAHYRTCHATGLNRPRRPVPDPDKSRLRTTPDVSLRVFATQGVPHDRSSPRRPMQFYLCDSSRRSRPNPSGRLNLPVQARAKRHITTTLHSACQCRTTRARTTSHPSSRLLDTCD